MCAELTITREKNIERVEDLKKTLLDSLKGSQYPDIDYYKVEGNYKQLLWVFPQSDDLAYDEINKIGFKIKLEWIKGISRLENGSEETCLALSGWRDPWDTLCRIQRCMGDVAIVSELSAEQVDTINNIIIPGLCLKCARDRLKQALGEVMVSAKGNISGHGFIQNMIKAGNLDIANIEAGIGKVEWLYNTKIPLWFYIKQWWKR